MDRKVYEREIDRWADLARGRYVDKMAEMAMNAHNKVPYTGGNRPTNAMKACGMCGDLGLTHPACPQCGRVAEIKTSGGATTFTAPGGVNQAGRVPLWMVNWSQ